MKKLNTIILFIFIFLLVNVSYSQVNLGLIGGVNIATLSGNLNIDSEEESTDFKNITAIGIGGIVDLSVNENISILFQPMYLQKGGKQSEAEPGVGQFDAKLKINYLEIPALLKLTLGANNVRPYIMAGPSLGINISTDLEFSLDAPGIPTLDVSVDAGDVTESIDFGLVFGGGLSFVVNNMMLFIEGKYSLGLSNVLKEGTLELFDETSEVTGELKTRGIQIMGGVSFPLSAQ